ncbi:MAG: CAP domain-containing protein [Patescibacteria group bacterium]|nr:CAP domain-containing protein [Patescibacteria group bacterium]
MKKPLLHHLHDYFFPHPRNNYRPHLFSVVSVAVLVCAVVIFEAGYLVQTKIVFLKTDFLASVLPGALVVLTNQDRTTLGLAGVIEDPLLNKAAQAAAEDMANKGYFAHVSPDGKDPWYWLNQVGYTYSYAGQNLAVNFTDSTNVESAWMESPTHRANILKPQYTQVGFGTANGLYEGKETTFVVEFFATPASTVAEKVAVAPAKSAPLEQETTTAPVRVLGIETSGGVVTVAPAPTEPNWFVRLLASPLSTLVSVFTALLIIIAVSFTFAFFMRGKMLHPRIAISGALLLVFISALILASVAFAGPTQLSVSTQTASIGGVLLP